MKLAKYLLTIPLLFASTSFAQSPFPQVGHTYAIDFESEPTATMTFIDDSSMVYGDAGTKRSFHYVKIERVSDSLYTITWNEGREGAVRIQHTHDLAAGRATSRISFRDKQYELKGAIRLED